jgi:hypothetical protein
MRILLWFQFFLAVIETGALLVGGVILSGRADAFGPAGDAADKRLGEVSVLLLLTLGTAILLAICASLVRRRRIALYSLVVVAEFAILAGLGYSLYIGLFAGLAALLLVLLGAWILVDLFHRDVRAFVRRQS